MKQVVDKLKAQEYVNAGNVEALRKYVRIKHPGSSEKELSAVFADALHKIMDTRLCQFEEKHRKRIKDAVIRKAVKKKEFTINAAEVFSSCLSLKLREDSYIDSFTLWINQNQPIPVTADKVDRLVSQVVQLEEEYIAERLDEIVGQYEVAQVEDEPQWLERVSEFMDAQSIEDGSIAEASEIESPELSVPEERKVMPEAELPQAQQESSSVPIILAEKLRELAAIIKDSFRYLLSLKPVLAAAIPLVLAASYAFADLLTDNRIHALQHQDGGRYANIAEEQLDRYLTLESRVLRKLEGLEGQAVVLLDGLHEELKYVKVDEKKLKQWLDKKNSMLADDPYFSAILSTSKKYDVHPLLMFAIVGQEQAFVPKNGAAARKIANNPFNVYGSWEVYNTNIYDSSSLAADTIIKASRNRPAYINAIRWINRRYAEDPNWWNGVSKLFEQMKKEVMN